MKKKEYSLQIGEKTLIAEFSDLSNQANGSVTIRYGNTVLHVTAVMAKYAREGADFFPLTVDYEEKFYAAGAILGSRFVRREGKPTDEAILSGRIIDRTIRPLFDKHIRNEVQVVITIISIDEHDPDILGVIGASLALGTSDIPWNGPVSAVRLTQSKSGSTLINPSYEIRDHRETLADLTICGRGGKINMIEVAGKQISEQDTMSNFKKASEEIEKIQKFQEQIISEIGKEKVVIEAPVIPEDVINTFNEKVVPQMDEYVFAGPDKSYKIDELRKIWIELMRERIESDENIDEQLLSSYYEEKVDEYVHSEAIGKERRPDGRKIDEIRPLYAQAGGVSPILHGTGIFYRGGTHMLTVATLGGPKDTQVIDGIEGQIEKRYMHHYNFPPYSSGETGRVGGTNRRMIGHGSLAEKALVPVIPEVEDFPYTIRVVSESMASNGSTSMGSVCGSTLALLDAGVPIVAPVAGIASGLMLKESKSTSGGVEYDYKILTDIQGPEDHHGDMDFKVAGTRDGITAVQMDVKVDGIPLHILSDALDHAKNARLKILDVIQNAIPEPRPEISPRAPKILTTKIKVDQIGLVIGTGGKTINEIKEKTGADIDIEDDGKVFISGKNGSADQALKIIEQLTHEYKAGEKFKGEVTKITDFGAFVKIAPNTEGMVHISEVSPKRIDRVDKYLKEGDIVPVVIKEIDERDRIALSIKRIDPNFFQDK